MLAMRRRRRLSFKQWHCLSCFNHISMPRYCCQINEEAWHVTTTDHDTTQLWWQCFVSLSQGWSSWAILNWETSEWVQFILLLQKWNILCNWAVLTTFVILSQLCQSLHKLISNNTVSAGKSLENTVNYNDSSSLLSAKNMLLLSYQLPDEWHSLGGLVYYTKNPLLCNIITFSVLCF